MLILHELTIFAAINLFLMKVLYYLLLAVCYPLSLLPFWVHYIFADILYLLIYYVDRYRVKVVRKNLKSAFPEKSEEELRRIEKDFYQWFCDYIVETIKLMTINRKEMKRRMAFKNPEALDEAVASGQSVALYLGHLCNWEWVSSVPLWVKPDTWCGQIYHPLENKDFDRLFLKIRERMDAHCIAMQDTLREQGEPARYHRLYLRPETQLVQHPPLGRFPAPRHPRTDGRRAHHAEIQPCRVLFRYQLREARILRSGVQTHNP